VCRVFFGLASSLGIGETPPPPLSGTLVRNLLLLQAWNDRTSSWYKRIEHGHSITSKRKN
jgi:hypothetical protein